MRVCTTVARVSCDTRSSGSTRTTTCGWTPWRDMEQAQVLTFRDGRVALGREYFDRAEAVEVAGLREEA